MTAKKTPTAPPPSIDEILKQGNNAAIVDRLGKSQQAALEAAPKPKSLAEMSGGFKFAGKDFVSGMEFYGRKPKIGQLQRILDLAKRPATEEESASVMAMTDRMAELVSLLLFVPIGPDQWRPATVGEIKEAFDLDELGKIRDQFSGLKANPEGNA